MSNSEELDVVILGGGVMGCAAAQQLSLMNRGVSPPLKMKLLEATSNILTGSSRGNSAMIHSGFDTTPNTIESTMVRRGHELFQHFAEMCHSHGIFIPWRPVGAIMVVFNEPERSLLQSDIQRIATLNQVETKLLSQAELRAMEPHISPSAVGGLHIPSEWIVDPWIVPALYLARALANGLSLELGARVSKVERLPPGGKARWRLETSNGKVFNTRIVVNCTGLHSESIEQMRRGGELAPFKVFPRLGRFIAFEPAATSCLNHMILPLPTKKTKGRIIFPTVYGTVVAGPTAEDPDEVRRPQREIESMLREEAIQKVPALKHFSSPAFVFSGKRPALKDRSDYFLDASVDDGWVTVAGVRSTGLTSCMAVAEWVGKQVQLCNGISTDVEGLAAAAVVPLTQREVAYMQTILRPDVDSAVVEAVGVMQSLKQSHPISAEGRQWRGSKAKPKL